MFDAVKLIKNADTDSILKKVFINFTENGKKFCLSLYYSYLFIDGVKTMQFKLKDSGTKSVSLYLRKVSNKFSVDNVKSLVKWICL